MRRKVLMLLLALLVFFGTGSISYAVNPDEMLDDPVLEKRAREISKNLRCLVCQNENIDESNADLARDIRILLRERLKAGDTDEEAIQYLVDRYGEYVLLKPRFGLHTLFLWTGPFIVLVIGAIGLYYTRRRMQNKAAAARVEADLTEEEQKRLQELLESEGDRTAENPS